MHRDVPRRPTDRVGTERIELELGRPLRTFEEIQRVIEIERALVGIRVQVEVRDIAVEAHARDHRVGRQFEHEVETRVARELKLAFPRAADGQCDRTGFARTTGDEHEQRDE